VLGERLRNNGFGVNFYANDWELFIIINKCEYVKY